MNEAIYQQVDDAIQRRLHLGGVRQDHTMHWWRVVRIEDGNIMIVTSDCGQDRDAYPITTAEWADRVEKYGLYRSVGMWHFVLADDPAADAIACAERCPGAAGRELYELRKKVKELEHLIKPPSNTSHPS